MSPFSDTLHLLAANLRNRPIGQVLGDQEHLRSAMQWLVRAQEAGGSHGVAAGYHLLRGWAPPYPETTGYIIPTFLRYAGLAGEPEYRRRALAMADWELALQLPNGAIPGRTGEKADPIVFDTAQVIFGWLAAYRASGDSRYLSAARRAADWLLTVQEADGAWRRCEYLGVAHAYNSRVSWALLVLSAELGETAYAESAGRQLEWTLAGQGADGWIEHMAFDTWLPPFTHTIAYTLEGLWESSAYVDKPLADRLVSSVRNAWSGLGKVLNNPALAGRLEVGWQPAGNFVCLTGNAQLALIALRLYQCYRQPAYLSQAERLLAMVKITHPLNGFGGGVRGGVAGSLPFWGAYLPLWFPNWAAKFFCDALMLNMAVAQGESGFCDTLPG